MNIGKAVLQELSCLDIDEISTKVFCPDDIFLHKGKSLGIYIIGIGVVLEPVHADIMRFGDILKVGVWQDKLIYYGGFSITSKSFVIPPMYTEREFWSEFEKYQSFDKKATHE